MNGLRKNDIRLCGDQFFCKRLCPLFAGIREAIVDTDIAALRPAKPFEPLPERRKARLHFWIVLSDALQHTNAPYTVRLLSASRERPRRRAAEQRDELPPLHPRAHSITSSARASNVGGKARPSALAVLRLMTNSYLVGACTGMPAGVSPLRMRST